MDVKIDYVANGLTIYSHKSTGSNNISSNSSRKGVLKYIPVGKEARSKFKKSGGRINYSAF